MQRLLGCLSGKAGHPVLEHKAHLLALSLIKSLPDPQLTPLLCQIYMNLTQESEPPERMGSHWVSIGFQNVDPMTDTRGGGVLGLINILYLSTSHPVVCQEVLTLSR